MIRHKFSSAAPSTAALALALGAGLAGCRSSGSDSQTLQDAPAAAQVSGRPAAPSPYDGPALGITWIHGTQGCQDNHDPALQPYHLDDNTVIIRQNKCADPPTASFEAPFVYLLFGADKVLMLDSGSVAFAEYVPMRATVDKLISDWLVKNNRTSIQLILAHTHSHGDHIAGDGQFIDRANTTIVDYGQTAVGKFFGFSTWTGAPVTYDLGGGRILDVMPIPGHLEDHIAIYDRKDAVILSGDSLYPGHLFISDWNAYRASIARLAAFAADKPVAYVLGAHIEAKNQAGQFFDYGETFQPNEHVLELFKAHLNELNQALIDAGESPKDQYLSDFHIQPND